MSAFDVARKYLEAMKKEAAEAAKEGKPGAVAQIPQDSDPVWSHPDVIASFVDHGEVVAVLIRAPILDASIWLAFEDTFNPTDKRAVFYAEELALLKDKTPAELQKIHALKLGKNGLGTKVRQ
jgi:hypothetical protein